MFSRFSWGFLTSNGRVVRPAVAVLGVMLAACAVDASPGSAPDADAVRGLIDLGSYPQAEDAARGLLAITEMEHGVTARAACDARDLLVAALIANKRAFETETMRLAERAVELRLEIDDADSLATTAGLINLGKLLKENRQLDEAEEVLQRALVIRDRELGPDHLEIARVLNELGSVAYRGRDADLATTRYEQALAMLEVAARLGHPEYSVTLTGLCSAMLLRRQFAEAEAYQVRSLKIRQRSLGPRHPLTAESMRVLAMVLRRTGDDEEAEGLLREAVRILEQSLGPEHPQTGSTLNTLAIQVRDQGEYTEARGFFERALAAFETSLDPLDPRIAGVLNNLAAVYRELGDFSEAERCLKRSLAIREQRYGADHPAVAQSLGNLASVLVEAERSAEAVPLLERALVIKERAYGRLSEQYAVTLANLGRACRATGDLGRAERSLEEAVAIFEEQLGPEGPIVADQLLNLAMVKHDKGDFDEAREDILRSIEIRRAAGGESHPHNGRSYYNLARVEADAGHPDAAMVAALDAEALGREHLRLTARGLTENEAIGFDQYTRNRLDLLIAYSLRWPQYTSRVWDALIRSRGLVLNELVARRQAAASDDPDVVALLEELTEAAERLAKLSVRGKGKATTQAYREELAAARREVERLERALGDASAAFRDDLRRSQIGFDEVSEALPPGAALVGFIRRSIFPDPVGTRTPDTFDYMALVLAPGASAPTPVVLGPAPEVDALIHEWRRAAVGPGLVTAEHSADETIYRTAGEALRLRIWDPLLPLLGSAKTVFVVPDGEIGLVNLATLPSRGSTYLIETGPLIHMLDDERDLVAPPGVGLNERSTLLALGDPDFDWNGEATGSSGGSAASRIRGISGECVNLDEVVFRSLPLTAAETETIVGIWRRHHRNAVRLTGAQATETELKKLATGNAVLHLATHGFVLGDRCEAGSVAGRGIGGLAPSRRDTAEFEEPPADLLGVAGLALAGANHRREAMPNEDDGVITAMEIAYLDLNGVDWAVLSACDSGVGESISGEGVFGFRRAFRVAGARTVIMSLWPVEDEATLVWMESLYQGRLQEGMTTAESVRHASLEVLRSWRDKGLSSHPFYWGAFIAAGDWR